MEEFEEEIKFLKKKHGISDSDIRIVPDHPCGEDVLYIKGKFAGYIDEYFYETQMGIDMHMRDFKAKARKQI
ncbi:Hypothetical protein KNT65_gp241 [Escherichia phage EcS1]|uniref:Uncharacterized protein n=1 Tax=Escherichia phage EcS1 TaxID=2083276 RepID=A0A2Z5ZCV7_9CAUD|nr:Hypothetical protein KNT65_gp241 [Escherichia phage EcS1]BBC78252.1 Hypothetical protein [Escherichia phage EcS1]